LEGLSEAFFGSLPVVPVQRISSEVEVDVAQLLLYAGEMLLKREPCQATQFVAPFFEEV
jgi:hypothetical protein